MGIEAVPAVRGWCLLACSLGSPARDRPGLRRRIRAAMHTFPAGFHGIEPGNSPLATESWMMVDPSNVGRNVQRCTNGMETGGAYRKCRAFGFPILLVGVDAGARLKNGCWRGQRLAGPRERHRSSNMAIPRR